MSPQLPPADPRQWASWSRQTYGDTGAIDFPSMGAPRPNTEQFGTGFSGTPSGGVVGGGSSSSPGGSMRGAFEQSIMDTINKPGLSEHDIEGKINAGTEGIAQGEQNALLHTQQSAESMGIGGGAVSAANRNTLSDYAGQRADFAATTRTNAANDASQQRLGALNAGAAYYGHQDDNARQDRDMLVNLLSRQQNTSSSNSNSNQFSNAPTNLQQGPAQRHGVAGPAENGPVMMARAFRPDPGGDAGGGRQDDEGGGSSGDTGSSGGGRALLPIDNRLSDADQRREDLIQRQSDARFPQNPFSL